MECQYNPRMELPRFSMIEISNPSPDELASTLELAFGHLPTQERQSRLEAVLSMLYTDSAAGEGVFQARLHGKRVGALFSFKRPDGAVLLWAPVMLDGLSPEPFFEPLARFCRKNGARAAVILVDRNQPCDRTALAVAGFEYLSDMLYMVVSTDEVPNEKPLVLNFLPMNQVPTCAFERMVDVVQKTYRNSRDFPGLLSHLPVPDVLEGYGASAEFRPELWFFIRKDGRDVGALLLTDQPEEQLELTYMGLVEEVRGRGFGPEIVGFAQNVARQRNRRHLLTSVDERNPAALKSYLSMGMNVWDRKSVFVRIFNGR